MKDDMAGKQKISELQLSVGAMAEMTRMMYDALVQQNFTPDQALKLTGDYMRGVFGK